MDGPRPYLLEDIEKIVKLGVSLIKTLQEHRSENLNIFVQVKLKSGN